MLNVYRRRGRLMLAVAFAGCATNASAQSMDCVERGREITCEPRHNGGAARGIADLISRTKDNAVRKRVGQMLASGNCEDAARYAYSKGRLELAAQVLQSCQPTLTGTSQSVQSARSDTNLSELLSRTAEAIRAESYPEDDSFKLVKVEPIGTQLQLTIGTNRKVLMALPDNERTRMTGVMCAEPAFLPLLQHGASVRIAFTDLDGRKLSAIMLTRQICGF